MSSFRLATLATLAALLAGCGMHHPMRTGGSLQTGPAGEVTAVAHLRTPEGRPGGTVRMTETSQGVLVVAQVEGLGSPGPRGFHIHTAGNCRPSTDASGRMVPFGAAEGHFDPGESGRHGPPAQPPTQSHAGDMPNLPVQADGRGSLSILNPNITLGPGPRSAMGRSVVVHDKPDDLRSQPAGDSGARVLCGVIVPA
ncbi:superoxide dismutase family protein [Ramlibacter sp. AW1]|uniref:Superoxide dismutase family protein n=1 Tax=Ramlibacter aurantiacus TaxID=2801330 RepID=A0A937D6T3_9BURK|nr:superoxide dismutase family protein [Ramlibacter aurantiacus]MBL0421283.1 superoxide dismutase family protein [Ramlibacter aurantiacus]